jgi:hypothetical protein
VAEGEVVVRAAVNPDRDADHGRDRDTQELAVSLPVSLAGRLVSSRVASHEAGGAWVSRMSLPVASCRQAKLPLHAGGRRFESCTAHFARSNHAGLDHGAMQFERSVLDVRARAVLGAVLGRPSSSSRSSVRKPRSRDVRLANSVRQRSGLVSAWRCASGTPFGTTPCVTRDRRHPTRISVVI